MKTPTCETEDQGVAYRLARFQPICEKQLIWCEVSPDLIVDILFQDSLIDLFGADILFPFDHI